MTFMLPCTGNTRPATRSRVERPDLSVIVSTFERPGHLRLCLESIASQTDVSDRIEVVVCDDGSRDATISMVAAFSRNVPFRVAVTTHAHDGFRLSQSRNEGVAASTADRILFTDGDCLLPRGTLAKYIDAIRPGRIAGGDSYRFDEGSTAELSPETVRSGAFLRAVTDEERRRLGGKSGHAKVYEFLRLPMRPRLYGNAIGISRADYERLNGFDEAFVGWGLEDRDLQMRAEKLGIRVKGMFEHAFVHQWHAVDPSWARNAIGTANHQYYRRGRVEPTCRLGYSQRAADTVVAFDFRPMLVAFGKATARRVAA